MVAGKLRMRPGAYLDSCLRGNDGIGCDSRYDLAHLVQSSPS